MNAHQRRVAARKWKMKVVSKRWVFDLEAFPLLGDFFDTSYSPTGRLVRVELPKPREVIHGGAELIYDMDFTELEKRMVAFTEDMRGRRMNFAWPYGGVR